MQTVAEPKITEIALEAVGIGNVGLKAASRAYPFRKIPEGL